MESPDQLIIRIIRAVRCVFNGRHCLEYTQHTMQYTEVPLWDMPEGVAQKLTEKSPKNGIPGQKNMISLLFFCVLMIRFHFPDITIHRCVVIGFSRGIPDGPARLGFPLQNRCSYT